MSYQEIYKGLHKSASAEQVKELAVMLKKTSMQKKAGLGDPITDTQVTEARLNRQQRIADANKPKPGFWSRWGQGMLKANPAYWGYRMLRKPFDMASDYGYKQGRKDTINQAAPLLTQAKKTQADLTNRYNDLQQRYDALQNRYSSGSGQGFWSGLLGRIGRFFSALFGLRQGNAQ